jgi:hypothetical protein
MALLFHYSIITLATSIIITLAISGHCHALLSPREKLRYCTHIFTGTIVDDVELRNEQRAVNYVNLHFRCRVRVSRVIRSACREIEAKDCVQVEPGSLVFVYGWQASTRPEGFRGSWGMTSAMPARGQVYSFAGHYLHQDELRRDMYHNTFPIVGNDAGLPEYNMVVPNGVDLEGIFPMESDEL